jgi:hypothetical protein
MAHCADERPDLGFGSPPTVPAPLVPVSQLYAAVVPDLPFPAGTDVLQLLWCPHDQDPYYAPRPEVRWRSAPLDGPALARPPNSAGAPDHYIPAPCILHPERIVRFPQWDLPKELRGHLLERFGRLKEESGWPTGTISP